MAPTIAAFHMPEIDMAASPSARWQVERIVHFDSDDFVVDGLAHFGFHVRDGSYYPIDHPRHVLGCLDRNGRLAWTAAATPVVEGIPNLPVELDYPMFVDLLADGSLVVSNFGNARLVRIDPGRTRAEVLVDGHDLGMSDMGNCVVDARGSIWVNEVTGCRIWRFDAAGRVLRTLGDGAPGFGHGRTGFDRVRFNWIYDIRRGPDDRLYVLDSRNFALRVVDPADSTVTTIAGTGEPGYGGDGGPATMATFGSDPTARFDGPISLALDEAGNAYVGDRQNHVVRMIEASSGTIHTIAGRPDAADERLNDVQEREPAALNLPQISSLDYAAGRLFVPTDLGDVRGDLVVLRRH